MNDLDITANEDAFVADPYAFYRQLREDAPAYQHEESGLWFLTRYEDVERAMTDYETFSSSRGNVLIDSPQRVGKTLGSMDPPRHDELRRIIQRGLSNARIKAMLPSIHQDVKERVAALADKRSCDLIGDIGRPVMFDALGRMLGLDAESAKVATRLTKNLFHQNEGLLGPVLQPEEFRAIFAFLAEQLEKRRQGLSCEGGEDLFSVLLEAKNDGAPMSDDEIVANMSTVLLAGNASIGHFFPNLMHALWLHPDQRRKVLDDLSLIPAVIEEAVRWDTSTQCFARHIVKDVEIAGTVIPEGSRAAVFYAAANHDENAIPAAATFDIERKRVRHFGFGLGPHVCAGAPTARAMLGEMLKIILPALGEYELDVANAPRVRHAMVRGFVSLPASWN